MNEKLESALSRAEKAQQRGLGLQEKREVLQRLRDKIKEARSLYSEQIRNEAKKPPALADAEVLRAIGNISEAIVFLSGTQDRRIELVATPSGEAPKGTWRPFPRGVIVGITPYNFPLNLILHKVLPAICSGAPIIIKPDPRTPSPARKLEMDLAAVGLPPGFMQVVECSVEEAESLCGDARVEVISFTGSEHVGWHIKAKHPTKHVLLELGGTATAIYAKPSLDGSDVSAITRAALAYSGQVCISTQNVLIPESLLADAKAAFRLEMGKVSRESPDCEDSLYGPVIDQRHADRLLHRFRKAAEQGAEVWKTGDDSGLNLAARLITLPNHQFEIAQEEIFGPALVLIPYQDSDHAEEIFRQLKSTLQAAVFTDDDSLWQQYQSRLRSGAILRNRPPTFRQDGMPYGGVKTSGIGREGVAYAFEEFSERRLIIE